MWCRVRHDWSGWGWGNWNFPTVNDTSDRKFQPELSPSRKLRCLLSSSVLGWKFQDAFLCRIAESLFSTSRLWPMFYTSRSVIDIQSVVMCYVVHVLRCRSMLVWSFMLFHDSTHWNFQLSWNFQPELPTGWDFRSELTTSVGRSALHVKMKCGGWLNVGLVWGIKFTPWQLWRLPASSSLSLSDIQYLDVRVFSNPQHPLIMQVPVPCFSDLNSH